MSLSIPKSLRILVFCASLVTARAVSAEPIAVGIGGWSGWECGIEGCVIQPFGVAGPAGINDTSLLLRWFIRSISQGEIGPAECMQFGPLQGGCAPGSPISLSST